MCAGQTKRFTFPDTSGVYREKITIIIYYELIKLNEPLSNKKSNKNIKNNLGEKVHVHLLLYVESSIARIAA